MATLLQNAGFDLIREADSWASRVRPGGKYYLTRNASSIVAFTIGNRWRPGNPVAITGAHTDSPCLRLKPVSKKCNLGYLQVAIETYGGGIWHSWFDRDLSVAGRVMVRDQDHIVQRNVKIDRPLLRIPTLAIHLDRQSNFDPNKETELLPIAGIDPTAVEPSGILTSHAARDPLPTKPADEDEEVVVVAGSDAKEQSEDNFSPLPPMTDRHHPGLIEAVANQLEVNPSDIVDFELVLYDTQKACLGGLREELIFSPRLDNLCMTFCSVAGLLASVSDQGALKDDETIRMAVCFDHEEIGSQSAQGALSNLLPAVLRRLAALPGAFLPPRRGAEPGANEAGAAYEQMLSRSFLLSADMAHAVHPNYSAKYEEAHRPALNHGPVIKVNANQRYATNSPGIVLLQECAQLAKVPLQLFVVRNDSSCGSTIGPGLAAQLGVRTLDMGNPQLSMHSIRETGGADDVEYAIRLFDHYFQGYGRLGSKIVVD